MFSTGQAPVRYVREVQAPSSVGSLWISAEANTSAPSVDQRIELWDWANGEWDQLAVSTDMDGTDKARTAFLGVPGPYVNGTNNIRTRVSYFASGPVFAYPWDVEIDHVRVFYAP